MKKLLAFVSTTLLLGATGFAQTASNSGAASAVSTNNVALRSDVTITGELQGSLSAEKAKVGDEIILKTTKAVNENGRTVIKKGSRLLGRVTHVKQKTKERNGSEIGIVFDRVKQGDQTAPVTLSILSIARVESQSRTVDDTFAISSSRPSTVGTSTQSIGNRGLVGTTTTTAAGLPNTVRDTSGTVLDTSGRRTGSATGVVETNIRGLQINQSVDATMNGSTTLGMNSGNMKLESGTIFTVTIAANSNGSSN